MILMTGLDSIIESLYLRENLTNKVKDSDIIVNPVSTYLIRKTIIINRKYYPFRYIDELIRNGNTIISRFSLDRDDIVIDPYELRINDRIMRLGKDIKVVNEHMYDGIDHIYEDGILYYPKPRKYYEYHYNGNLTVLGYLLYQLGCDVSKIVNTEFTNLDIIKMKSGIIV